jgi:hypothetical protein
MKRRILVLFAGVVLLAASGRAFAHHSFSAEYDSTQKVELDGVVTQFVWRNPHSFMKIDVMEKDGTTKSWASWHRRRSRERRSSPAIASS